MKKIHLALMCMVSLAIVTACGGGNASKNAETQATEASEQTEEQVSTASDDVLTGTTWTVRKEAVEGDGSYYVYTLTFSKGGKSTFDISGYNSDGSRDESVSRTLSGTYTFDGEYKGTVDYGKKVDPGYFHYQNDGSEIDINVAYEHVTLTKAE